MSELTSQLSQELQFKFLYHLWMLVEETKINSVKVSKIWKRMNIDSNKEKLLPIIINILKEFGTVKEGDTSKEVKLIYKKRKKQRLYILDVINNIVNDSEGSSVGVTLTIGGTLITGNLISNRKYYSLFFEQMKSVMPEKEHRYLANAFNTIDEQIPKTDEEKEVMSKILGRDTICLENPSYFINNNIVQMGINNVPWIGRIEKVDAFILGILNLNIP
jgi:hypothetical protein